MNVNTINIACEKDEFPICFIREHDTYLALSFKNNGSHPFIDINFFIRSKEELERFRDKVVDECNKILKEI